MKYLYEYYISESRKQLQLTDMPECSVCVCVGGGGGGGGVRIRLIIFQISSRNPTKSS